MGAQTTRLLPWIGALLLTACGAHESRVAAPAEPLTKEEPQADVPEGTAEADAAFRNFLSEAQFSLFPDQALQHSDVLGEVMKWKTDRGQEVHQMWEDVVRGEDLEATQLALLRVGQAYLNLGCEIASSPAPAQLASNQRDKYRQVLQSSGLQVLGSAREALQKAEEVSTDRYRTDVEAVLTDWPVESSDVADACADKREYWVPEELADPEEVFEDECDEGTVPFCWLWAEHGSGGIEALQKSCDAGFARGCKTLGDWYVLPRGGESPDASSAEASYARACQMDFEEGCRAQLAVVDPAREEEYQDRCLHEDDAAACLKLARLLEAGRLSPTMWSRCTGDAELPDERQAEKSCRNGDAAACAIRASYLPSDERFQISVRGPEDPDGLDRVALQCIEGDNAACRDAADIVVVGEPSKKKNACATVLLLQACRRGDTAACGFARASTSLSGH